MEDDNKELEHLQARQILLPPEQLRPRIIIHLVHGPSSYKDTKPQMLSLLVFNRVYRLENQSVM
jgi:hypothetical protein